jgi:N-acetylglutamate synthase-like GNAT family acetyltransferase
MEILNLKDSLVHFDKIAEYHQEEWAHLNDEETLEERKVRMQAYLSDSFIPSMYIAKIDNEIIGTAAIVKCDLDTRPNLSPWMASIFVFPKHRKKGHSKKLVKHIMEQAKENSIDKLYLYTEDADKLYEKLGWNTISREVFLNQDIIVMEADL